MPKQILIVDEDRDFAEGMAEVLELEGHRVVIVHDGEAAIETFREDDFDITFMDVRLPGKNVVESFFAIRDLKPDAKMVMMTPYGASELLLQATSGGSWKVVYKPLDTDVVLGLLEEAKQRGMVLVAENDSDFTDGIREALEQEGYHTRVASNGQQALDVLDACKADVLILVLRMPIMGGLETIHRMKQRECMIPTIIATAYSEEESDVISPVEPRTCGLIKKIFDPGRLIAAIEELEENPI